MQMIWKNCGISLGKIVVNTMLFNIHKNLYFLRICGNFNISKVAFARHAERCVRRSRGLLSLPPAPS